MCRLNILFIILLISVGCSNAKEEEYTPSVQVNTVEVNGIKRNTRENEIYKILGRPSKITSHGLELGTDGKAKTIHYTGLSILLVNSRIYHLECNGTFCKTNKGIHIGSNRTSVVKEYGAPSKYETTGKQISYTFKINERYLYSSLVFLFEKNKVISITYHVDYT